MVRVAWVFLSPVFAEEKAGIIPRNAVLREEAILRKGENPRPALDKKWQESPIVRVFGA
jgi:hypothetical protein